MSSVFFRFRNQKEDQRVIFDGTGITVFELKREIINISKLGDGKDFDLILKSPDGTEGKPMLCEPVAGLATCCQSTFSNQ